MIDYTAVLIANYPDSIWTLDGDDYSGLTWMSDTPKPTQAELETQWPALGGISPNTFKNAALTKITESAACGVISTWNQSPPGLPVTVGLLYFFHA